MFCKNVNCKFKTIALLAIITAMLIFLVLNYIALNNHKNFDFKCSYNIISTVVPKEKILKYSQFVSISNAGKDKASDLYFNIYANRKLASENKIEIEKVLDKDGSELPFEVKNDKSVVKVKLKRPIQGDNTENLIFRCKTELPKMTDYYGIAEDGEIHLPLFNLQLAVYDKNGWNIASTVKNGDGRYSEVASYSLFVSLPSNYEAISNAKFIKKENDKGQTTYNFAENSLRDLFLAMNKNYARLDRAVGKTTLTGFFNKNRLKNADLKKVMDKAVFALKFYNEILGEYPFNTLIITNSALPPEAQMPGINMEYSGLVTLALDERVSEQIIYHEIAHQWFYFIVGNNEETQGWLDEGIVQYLTALCVKKSGNTEIYNKLWARHKEISKKYSNILLDTPQSKLSTDEYYSIIYNRSAYFFKELSDIMGETQFLSALKDYVSKYKYKNATPQDFIEVMKLHSSKNIDSVVSKYIKLKLR